MASCTVFIQEPPASIVPPYPGFTGTTSPVPLPPRDCVDPAPIVNLAVFDLTAYAGALGTVTASELAPGVTSATLTLGAGLTEDASSGGGAFVASGWDAWAAVPADRTTYWEYVITMDATHYALLTALYASFVAQDPEAPVNWAAYTGLDNYATPRSTWVAEPGNPSAWPLGVGISGVQISQGTSATLRVMQDANLNFAGSAVTDATALVAFGDINATSHMGIQARVYTVS